MHEGPRCGEGRVGEASSQRWVCGADRLAVGWTESRNMISGSTHAVASTCLALITGSTGSTGSTFSTTSTTSTTSTPSTPSTVYHGRYGLDGLDGLDELAIYGETQTGKSSVGLSWVWSDRRSLHLPLNDGFEDNEKFWNGVSLSGPGGRRAAVTAQGATR
ncbi:hypothetical protein AOQ84DRAFT_222652 [Glonium stellatum]|uniref:Uncharacterized protein n=1 Tax=Glonium stellatum TaxID=574774 RepID=A0A8E2EZD1_9PEZI|nr:hypothetical protein AOQ84DRAFT_222652 [Glonium stellatum]